MQRCLALAMTFGACFTGPDPPPSGPTTSAPSRRPSSGKAPLIDRTRMLGASSVAECARAGTTATRIGLDYDGTILRITCYSVDVVVPPTESPRIARGQAGFWYEVHDGNGALIYQQVGGHGLLHDDTEVFDGSGGHRTTAAPTAHQNVDIVIPNRGDLATLEIFDSPGLGASAVLVARIPLR